MVTFSFQAREGSLAETLKAAGESCGRDRTGILGAVQTTFLEQAVCGALVVAGCCSEPLNVNGQKPSWRSKNPGFRCLSDFRSIEIRSIIKINEL